MAFALRAQTKYIFGAAIAIVIMLGIGLFLSYVAPLQPTGPQTGSTSLSTLTSTTNPNLSPCSTPYSDADIGPGFALDFNIQESSSLLLCVQFFYYSSGNLISVNSLGQLSIRAENYSSDTNPRSAMSNFTVAVRPSNFSIGGTSNENEGIAVEYDIQANAVSNGTYGLDLGWLAPQIAYCYSEFKLIVGNGNPNYFSYGGGCITLTQRGSDNSSLPSDTLFAKVVEIGYAAN